VNLTYYYPSLHYALQNAGVAMIGTGVEYPYVTGNSSIDLTPRTMKITFKMGATFNNPKVADSFNGFVLTSLTSYLTQPAYFINTTISGREPILQSTNTTISLNFILVSVMPSDTIFIGW